MYRGNRPPRFRRVKAPDKGELEELVQLISQRVGRCLERQGLLEKDTESAWLDLDPAEDTDAMPQILGSSVSYRIAVGPQQGPMVWLGCWAYRTARVRIGYMSCMQWRLTDQKSAGRGAAHDEKQHIET